MDPRNEEKAQLIMELRRIGIHDENVLKVMESIPREIFVPDTFLSHAYDNTALPIARGQTISQPDVVALMTQNLELDNRKKVLEIGTGSGYQSVILSHLSRRVYSVERFRELSLQAQRVFKHLGRHNIVTKVGDGGLGWAEQAPFERIIVTAAAEDFPPVLIDQLAVGGIMIVPVGDQDDMQMLYKVTKYEDHLDMQELGPVRFVPMLAGKVMETGQNGNG